MESFAYVFTRAQRLYEVAEISEALRAHAADAIVHDPDLGTGVQRDDGHVVYPNGVRS